LEVIPTTFGIILLTFVLFNVVGGSPAQVILGKNATAESIAAFNHKYGYDLPLPKQFVKFCTDLAKGDFGVSTEADEPVIDVLKRGVGPSLSLTVPILAGGTVIGLMLAMLCAAGRGGRLDKAVLVGSTMLMSVNYVVWVLAGQFILAFKLKLFPVWGYENAFYLVLPVIIGIFSGLGVDVRFFRTAILDEIYKPYVRTARMKGLSETRVLFVHVLRNSLIPIVTYVSLAIPYLFTGSLMLESFFGIPGLGNVSINAIHSSDMAVVRAVVVLGALLYQGINLVTDLLYAWLDPRVRLG
jgi:peptide/nickel transport system permease protein